LKRFWQTASILDHAGGYALALDGKLRCTPFGHSYACPTPALAAAIAAEWQQAPDPFDPRRMPLTQLVATTHDLVAKARAATIQQLLSYAGSDLLCLRAAAPPALASQQETLWQPYLTWAATHVGATLHHTTALQPLIPAPAALAALQTAISALNDYQLTALQQATDLTGSLVLGLALVHQWRDVTAIHHAAELETRFQLAQWGADPAAENRQAQLLADLTDVATFITLLGIKPSASQ
jgi:chaperone required for assembly of F1-ATPase